MQGLIQAAQDAAQKAGKLILEKFGYVSYTEKSINNLVTEADVQSELLISQILLSAAPGSKILGEENHNTTDFLEEKLWIVDPLDGTSNYAHGIPQFCVSIAYANKGEIIFGVVYDPIRNELFCGIKDHGATLNGKQITVSNRKLLKESIIVTGFHYDRGALMEKTLCAIRSLFKQDIRGIRRLGSAALDICWVACGRFDAYFEYMLSPWDFAAGMLILREANGFACDRNGAPLKLDSTGIICDNGHIHSPFLNTVLWDKQNVWKE